MKKPWMVVRWTYRSVWAKYDVSETMTAAQVREELGPTAVIVSRHATEAEALDIVQGKGPCTCKSGRLGDRIGLACPRCAHAHEQQHMGGGR